MGYTFDGPTRVISLTSGTVAADVRDLYSRWKDWVGSGAAQWLPAFATVGGEPVGTGVFITTYLFLTNGWRVRPQEAEHRLEVTGGVLLTDDGDDPILPTLGTYNVLVQYAQPIKTETVATGGVDVNALAAALWALIGPSGNTALESLETAAAEAEAAAAGVLVVDGKVDTIAADVAVLRQMESGRWRIVDNQMIFYADDGVTPLRTFDLKDADGVPTMTDVFERVPA